MSLGGLLQRQHRELAADALNFAEVARRGREVASFQEFDRWKFLSTVQDRYLAILDQLELWDLQTARLFAIEHRECRTDKDIVLVATTDMNMATRRMLDQVADRVTALVHADESLTDRFDEHGCLVPDAWQDAQIDLETRQMRVVQGPAEQADAVVGNDCQLPGTISRGPDRHWRAGRATRAPSSAASPAIAFGGPLGGRKDCCEKRRLTGCWLRLPASFTGDASPISRRSCDIRMWRRGWSCVAPLRIGWPIWTGTTTTICHPDRATGWEMSQNTRRCRGSLIRSRK